MLKRKIISSEKPMCEECLSTKISKIKDDYICNSCKEITNIIYNTL